MTSDFVKSDPSYRIDWVDYAKGICIILVVMMHSTLGVEKAIGQTGALSAFIEWARPFRMPDFFMISGLFLARRIHVPWRDYLDKKVVHFAYFYILWMTIQFALKGYGLYAEGGLFHLAQHYALGFIDPFGTLWFIYLLAIFFVATRLLQPVPRVLIFLAAAALEVAPIHTGWMVIDEFAARYVYFFVGYWLAQSIFQSAEVAWRRPLPVLVMLLGIWSAGHSLAMAQGMADLPLMSLVLGLAGCGAVILSAVLVARTGGAQWLRYLGANSIVIYLAFFLPMSATRSVGLKLWPSIHPDLLSTATTIMGVVVPVLIFWAVRDTPLSFLFSRPGWARLKPVAERGQGWHSGGHDTLSRPQAR
jgi:uncharacterized membrane protein YcfT